MLYWLEGIPAALREPLMRCSCPWLCCVYGAVLAGDEWGGAWFMQKKIGWGIEGIQGVCLAAMKNMLRCARENDWGQGCLHRCHAQQSPCVPACDKIAHQGWSERQRSWR